MHSLLAPGQLDLLDLLAAPAPAATAECAYHEAQRDLFSEVTRG